MSASRSAWSPPHSMSGSTIAASSCPGSATPATASSAKSDPSHDNPSGRRGSRHGRGLGAGELGLALFGEGHDALSEVGRAGHLLLCPGLEFELGRHPVVDPPVDPPLAP